MKFQILWFCAAFIIFSVFAKSFIKTDKKQSQNYVQETALEETSDAPVAAPSEPKEILEIRNFMAFYPDIEYQTDFDDEAGDWKVKLTDKAQNKSIEFYWAEGRLLPKSELPHKDDYWVLQYNYSNVLRDPKTFTEEELKNIREFGSTENRNAAGGTPMFFFDFLYSAKSRAIIEEHIVKTKFLGKTTKVHERILPALKRVEAEICLAANLSVETLSSADKISKIDTKADSLTAEQKEIREFIVNLRSADAYHWREIAETKRKSFHSYGIAVDVLPRRLAGRSIYWGWEKERSGDNWMLVPIKNRWMPPETVIRIFEKEGFIWGGYWIIFDNMHFEYHPELTGNL